MGLLQILSRRPKKAKSGESVVQQPQGDQPLQTTRSVSERIAEHRIIGSNREARLSKVSLNHQPDEYDMAAPPPLLSTLPPLNSERPGSSSQWSHSSENSGRFTRLQRPARESRRPPVSFRKPSSLTSLSRTYRAHDGPQADDAGSFVDNRGRSNSVTSTASRRSKDILDALEEIKPVEFRCRVLATGAKDYGEDVADRNLRLSTTMSTPNLGREFNAGRGYPISQSSRPGSFSLTSRTKSPNLSNSHRLTPATAAREWHNSTLTEAPTDVEEPGYFSKRNKNRLSLNTYIPSGLTSPLSPRSAVTTPGLRDGMAVKDFGSTNLEPDNLSRRYHLSPTASNFSVPRSPRVIRDHVPEQDDSRPEKLEREDDLVNEQRFGDIFTSGSSSRQRRSGSSVGHISLTKAGGRYSSQTFRSSLASSVTSRNPSVDFTPLGYPRLRSSFHADVNRLEDRDDSPSRRTLSLRSHHHSRSNSSEDGFSYRHSRTKSLVSAPSGLRNLLEIDEQDVPDCSGTSHDWNPAMSSNGSTSSSSNIYSGGSGRPASRHTKATSIDSTHQPLSSRKSEDSFLSTSHDQHGTSTSWSPTTTRSTGFNIDDYISSDDESFTTEKRHCRPTAQGEEDLLFKGGYGINGALPGLLEPIDNGPCPAPVVRFRRTESEDRQATTQHDAQADDPDAANSEDDRASVDRDLPVTLLRHVRSSAEQGTQGTFGRRARGSSGQTRRYSGLIAPTGEYGEVSLTSGKTMTTVGKGMYDEMPVPCRNQKRLSALGTLHGRNTDVSDALEDQKSTNDVRSNSDKEMPKMEDTIKEEVEKVDHTAAIKLRKEAKARKRAEDAKLTRERRLTRAFGPLEDDFADALTTQNEPEDLERGRTLVKSEGVKGKGKAVAVE